VIERLADPLVHLIRNSRRPRPGKRRTARRRRQAGAGTIRLGAHQSGGEVVITIRDDGRGIDRDRVRAKAEANGLIQPDQVLSDQELLQLIFAPGFSTAAAITNLSGRGVGMDVVKRTIEGLRGSIDIQPSRARDRTVSLRIPLTLAIIDGLLVRVGAGRYVIPLTAVEECLELSLEEDMRPSRPQPHHAARKAGAVPAPARTVRHRHPARSAPEDRRGLDRRRAASVWSSTRSSATTRPSSSRCRKLHRRRGHLLGRDDPGRRRASH
jgi:chemotaxis protein histidine kinase CheA